MEDSIREIETAFFNIVSQSENLQNLLSLYDCRVLIDTDIHYMMNTDSPEPTYFEPFRRLTSRGNLWLSGENFIFFYFH